MMIDSQAVKNTCNASIASKGYCFYKSTNGYHPEHLITELKKIYPQILTKIKFELSEKPSKQQKEAQGKSGFVPVKARWRIERSNAWIIGAKFSLLTSRELWIMQLPKLLFVLLG